MKRSKREDSHSAEELALERMDPSRDRAVVKKEKRGGTQDGTWLNAERLIKVGNSDLSDGKA